MATGLGAFGLPVFSSMVSQNSVSGRYREKFIPLLKCCEYEKDVSNLIGEKIYGQSQFLYGPSCGQNRF